MSNSTNGKPTLTREGMGIETGLPLELADDSPGALRDAALRVDALPLLRRADPQLRSLVTTDMSHARRAGIDPSLSDIFVSDQQFRDVKPGARGGCGYNGAFNERDPGGHWF